MYQVLQGLTERLIFIRLSRRRNVPHSDLHKIQNFFNLPEHYRHHAIRVLPIHIVWNWKVAWMLLEAQAALQDPHLHLGGCHHRGDLLHHGGYLPTDPKYMQTNRRSDHLWERKKQLHCYPGPRQELQRHFAVYFRIRSCGFFPCLHHVPELAGRL